MKTSRAIAAAILSVWGIAWGLSASSQSKQNPAPVAKNERTIRVLGDELRHNDATGIGSAVNFTLIDGETVVKGEAVKWNHKTKIAQATGNLSMTDPQADATGKKAVIQYGNTKRIVEIVDDVKITVRPKKKAGAQPSKGDEDAPRGHPAVITCDRLEYHYARDKKYAKLTGNYKVVQKIKDLTRNVTADFAEWFGLEDKILLHPPVYYEDSKGQKMNTREQVTLITTEGAESIYGRKVEMEFPVEDDEEAKPAPKPATGKP